MAKKTNKTSHVLNLLTNSASADETETTASGQDKKSDIQSHTAQTKVTVVDEGSRNDRVSQDILNRLSEELADEVPLEADDLPTELSAPSPVQTPVMNEKTVEPANTEKTEPVSADTKERKPDLADLEEIELEPADMEETDPVLKSGGRLSDQLQNNDFHFINVMEELIMQHDLEHILKQYNVCTCPRCKADVCALTLTGLPAKYVVAGDHSVSPILNYYKNRYRISILAELSKACNTVREHPHHKR
ncbi:MAG: late competence development ComFB family protein [Lachnospiraceae bacterium]|jgi:hypothetical protein|nr:late competence development ComFB family protein [Lachnospiraceae bacterium]